MASKKVYLVKNLSPWMLDELLAFADLTSYSVLLLRTPESKYTHQLSLLKDKGIEVITNPYRFNISIHKLFIAIRMILSYPAAFLSGYSAVVGWKALVWFLRLDERSIAPDANLHAQFATQPALIALLLKLQRRSITYTFTFHAYDIYFNNRWFNPLVNHSEHAFSISDYNINYVKQKFRGLAADRLIVSRLGAFAPANAVPSHSSVPFTIGFLGRFVEKKGVSYLLDAMAILRDKQVPVQLFLAGDGPLTESYQQQIKNESLANVKLIGPVHAETKTAFFKSIHAFVMPSVKLHSDMDGIPVVLMEAVSYNLPVIATDVSGMKEICFDGYNGRLISERDAAALASAILELATNSNEYQKFQSNAGDVFKEYNIQTNSLKKLKIQGWL